MAFRIDSGGCKVQFRDVTSSSSLLVFTGLRVSGDFTPFGMNVDNAEGLNWMQQQQQQQVPLSSACALPTVQSLALSKSRSTTLACDMASGSSMGLSKSRSTTSAHRVHFQLHPVTVSIHPNDDGGDYDGDDTGSFSCSSSKKDQTGHFGLKRSKSLGAGDMILFASQELDVTCFNPEIQAAIKRALEGLQNFVISVSGDVFFSFFLFLVNLSKDIIFILLLFFYASRS